MSWFLSWCGVNFFFYIYRCVPFWTNSIQFRLPQDGSVNTSVICLRLTSLRGHGKGSESSSKWVFFFLQFFFLIHVGKMYLKCSLCYEQSGTQLEWCSSYSVSFLRSCRNKPHMSRMPIALVCELLLHQILWVIWLEQLKSWKQIRVCSYLKHN